MNLDKAFKLLLDIWPEVAKCGHSKAAEAFGLIEEVRSRYIWTPCSDHMPETVEESDGNCWSDWCVIYSPEWTGPRMNIAQWWIPFDAIQGMWVDSESNAPYLHPPTHWVRCLGLPE